MITFHITEKAKPFAPEIRYTLTLWAINQSQEIAFSASPAGAFSVGTEPAADLRVSQHFTGTAAPCRMHPFVQVDGAGTDLFDPVSIDPLASAFQMVNSLQEYDAPEYDELNRYQYKTSFQKRLNLVNNNLVQQCFDIISKTLRLPIKSAPTRFFLSHDIDIVYGAIVEDGYNVIRKGRFDLFLKMLFHVAIARPDWLNMDQITALESAHDCKSIFFWIVNKGRINSREENADYRFLSKPIQHQFNTVAAQGFENGLHKSLSGDSFREEFAKYGNVPYANRYHFLKFQLPGAWHDIESAGLKLDASLGFSAEMGFRNSYGLPFNPFNFKGRQAFSFVEAPLHIMDRTFFQYKKHSPEEAATGIFDFFERNRSNCVLSILWHNNFFTNYKFKGYLTLYKQILAYISDHKFRTISAREIIQQYAISP
ncbi:MAG TPA: hypothetical protein VK658_07885 [Chryseolinea sp.]|nr:hypothetical protein [Chryseolinea sp.]